MRLCHAKTRKREPVRTGSRQSDDKAAIGITPKAALNNFSHRIEKQQKRCGCICCLRPNKR